MDNVTHTLAGLLLADSTVRLRARWEGVGPSARFRTVAAISSIVAANLPDADLLYTGGGADRLRYMLQHRGYTHTIVMAVVGAALVWGLSMFLWRWRARQSFSRHDASWLLGLLLVSTLSHILLDWTNSYGVHPFWPVDNRWRYGDAVFIIEPWLWVVSIPTLVAASTRRVVQTVLSVMLLAVLALAWRVDLVSGGAATALTLGALVFIALVRFLGAEARAIAAVGGWIAVTLLMAAAMHAARRIALHSAHGADPTAEMLDVVVSALPANPVCAEVITVERVGAMYRAATARVSIVPTVVPAAQCATRQVTGSLITSSRRGSTPAVHWDGEWSAPSAELAALARHSCLALAAMRFIRVPIWRAVADSAVLIGDIRYGGGAGNGFTDVRVPRLTSSCPGWIPPWTPPRVDLLGP